MGGRTTNRGARLTELIRTGADKAVIDVRLRNRGPDAYAPETYGASIKIRRTLLRSGRGSYLLFNAADKRLGPETRGGRPVYGEIGRMLARFNVQIDNPAVVMLQDTSRTFLTDMSGRKQYNFIQSATQLKQMADKIATARRNAAEMHKTIATKERIKQGDDEELARRRREYDEARGMHELEQREERLGIELAWALVAESEAEVDAHTERIAQQEEALRDAQRAADAARAEERRLRAEHEAADEEMERYSVGLQELMAEQELTSGEMDNLERERRALGVEAEAQGRRADRCKRAAEEAEQRIRLIRRRIDDGSWADEVKERLAEIDNLRKSLEKSRARHAESLKARDVARNQKMARRAAIVDAERQLEQCERDLKNERSESERANRRLAHVNRAAVSRNRLELYPQNFRHAQRSIRQRLDRFHRPPIGPLGCAIALTDPQWALAAEHGLAHMMRAYVVDSAEDLRTLQEIMREAGVNSPQAVISEFETDRYPIETDATTLYDVLKFDDAYTRNEELYPPAAREKLDENTLRSTVLNVIVDQASVERLVLVKERTDGYRQVERHQTSAVGNLTCLDRSGTKIFGRGRSIATVAFNSKANRFLAADDYAPDRSRLNDEARRCLERIAAAEDKRAEIGAELARLRSEGDEYASSERRLAQEASNHATAAKDAEAELGVLLEQQRESDGDMNERIQELESEIGRHRDAEAGHWTRAGEIEEEIRALDARMATLREKCDATEQRSEEARRKVAAASERARVLIQSHRTAVEHREDALSNVEACTARLDEVRCDLAAAEEDCARFMETATEGHPERITIPDGRTSETISDELDHVRALLDARRHQQHGGRDLMQIARDYENFNLNVQRKGQEIQVASGAADAIGKVGERRVRRLLNLRATYANIISTGFAEHLHELGRTGYLEMDHVGQKVHMRVDVDAAAANQAVHAADGDGSVASRSSTGRQRRGGASVARGGAVGTLSGGERTTTTVALLLALWRAVETPLRVLDEIDVFMDEAAREQAMEMLLSAALGRFRRQQLIVITPQGVDFAQGREGVRVLKLRPPSRGSDDAADE